MAKADLTVARVRELLNYEPTTGAFTWKAPNTNRVKVGAIAGWIDKDGYVQIGVDGRHYRAHHLAWFLQHGEWPTGDIDHRHGDRADNRISELREGSRSFNMQNQRRAKSGSRSGLLGVEWHEKSGNWHARIKDGFGKRHSLGYYKDKHEAYAAYLAAKRRLHEGCTI